MDAGLLALGVTFLVLGLMGYHPGFTWVGVAFMIVGVGRRLRGRKAK
jgi:hypothetical protein